MGILDPSVLRYINWYRDTSILVGIFEPVFWIVQLLLWEHNVSHGEFNSYNMKCFTLNDDNVFRNATNNTQHVSTNALG
jgi:hypothetical protein